MPARSRGTDPPLLRQAVGDPEQDAEDARKIAICQGWPSWLSIVLSPSAPAIAAGIVAAKIHQAMRSSSIRCRGVRPSGTRRGRKPDVGPEVGDDGDQGAEVKRDVERLVEVGVRLEVVPVRDPRHEDQVSRGGDRQQLGQALGDPEHERLPVGEAAGLLADVREGEDHRHEQQHRRDAVDAPGRMRRRGSAAEAASRSRGRTLAARPRA